ncbi:hypothetical protein PanWU01x14_033460, partial [Parasponia andersonii]
TERLSPFKCPQNPNYLPTKQSKCTTSAQNESKTNKRKRYCFELSSNLRENCILSFQKSMLASTPQKFQKTHEILKKTPNIHITLISSNLPQYMYICTYEYTTIWSK